MAEHAPMVLSYSHLKGFPRGDEALLRLKKIASMTKPIMRNHSWTVATLAEFFPAQTNLLGVNYNRGEKICIRLRYPGDRTQFLPIEQVIDTFLHELSHIVVGPHNEKFQKMWDTLRGEYDDLISKGYTGEGFLSKGHVLGGRRVPMHEVQQRMRKAAEARRARNNDAAGRTAGRRLGGTMPSSAEDIRALRARAAELRNGGPSTARPQRPQHRLEGCGNAVHTASEVTEIARTATDGGFQTKAKEDEANDAAIARLLEEMWREEDSGAPRVRAHEWSCPRCTLVNSCSRAVCAACDLAFGGEIA